MRQLKLKHLDSRGRLHDRRKSTAYLKQATLVACPFVNPVIVSLITEYYLIDRPVELKLPIDELTLISSLSDGIFTRPRAQYGSLDQDHSLGIPQTLRRVESSCVLTARF